MRNLALASLVALPGCLPELEGVEHGEITTVGSMDTDEPSQVPEEIQAVTDEFKTSTALEPYFAACFDYDCQELEQNTDDMCYELKENRRQLLDYLASVWGEDHDVRVNHTTNRIEFAEAMDFTAYHWTMKNKTIDGDVVEMEGALFDGDDVEWTVVMPGIHTAEKVYMAAHYDRPEGYFECMSTEFTLEESRMAVEFGTLSYNFDGSDIKHYATEGGYHYDSETGELEVAGGAFHWCDPEPSACVPEPDPALASQLKSVADSVHDRLAALIAIKIPEENYTYTLQENGFYSKDANQVAGESIETFSTNY